MISQAPKRLTGWLILFIILIGPIQFGGAVRSLTTVPDSFRPHLGDFPSLSTAIVVFQLTVGGSIALWACAAWILFRREPGTLKTAQTCFLVGGALRILGGFSIPLFGGLPPDASRTMIHQMLPSMAGVIAMIAVWHAYLVRSTRVRVLFADS